MENEIRQEVNEFCDRFGVKYVFICNKCDINESTFCRWRKGERNLSQPKLKRIKEFLKM